MRACSVDMRSAILVPMQGSHFSRRAVVVGLGSLPLLSYAAATGGPATWRDAARARDLPVLVRWPTVEPKGVVLYSHGLGGSCLGGAVGGAAWADAGFVVVHVQHPGSDLHIWAGGARAIEAAATPAQFLARAQDVAFVLDEVVRLRTGPWSTVPARIGVAGHSFGARVTMAIAGETFPAAIVPPMADLRPTAFLALSPGLEGPGNPRERLAAVTRPLLGVTGSLDGDPLGRGTTPEKRAEVFDLLPEGARAMLWLDGADHATFAGTPGVPLPREAVALAREPAHHALVASVTSDWWLANLADETAAKARMAAPAGLGASDRWRFG